MSLKVVLIVLGIEVGTDAASVRDSGPLACMYGNPRCGDYRSDGECPDVDDSLCAGFGSTVNAEMIMLDTSDACLACAFGDQHDMISNYDLQRADVGLPAMMNGLMRAVFDESSRIRLPPANSTKNLTSPFACWNPGPLCKQETATAGDITGGTALDYINDAAFNCGEQKLEDAACYYIADGAADAICKSKVAIPLELLHLTSHSKLCFELTACVILTAYSVLWVG